MCPGGTRRNRRSGAGASAAECREPRARRSSRRLACCSPRNGFRGTGTSDIAAAAGCSEPMIYKHFASKQALFAGGARGLQALHARSLRRRGGGRGRSVRRLPALRPRPRGRREGGRVVAPALPGGHALGRARDPSPGWRRWWSSGRRACARPSRSRTQTGASAEDADVESVAMLFSALRRRRAS